MAKLKLDKASLNEFLNKYYALLAVVLVLLIFGVGGFLLVYPQYRELVQVQEEQLSASEFDLVQKTQYLQDLREMEENFQAQNLENYRNLDKVIFTRSQFPLLFARLENIVSGLGMSIVNITYAPAGDEAEGAAGTEEDEEEDEAAPELAAADLPPGIGLLSVTMTVTSPDRNWTAFKELVNTLQYNIQLIEIESLSYSPSLEAYNLTFNMYFKEEKDA